MVSLQRLAITFILVSSTFGCQDLKCFDQKLNEKINSQIDVELTGHYTYLNLAQIFEDHKHYYPKVAKYLRAKSAEKLTHAEQFIKYQNQRGGTVKTEPIALYEYGACANIHSPLHALKCAMELEAFVTRQLTQLHQDVTSVKKSDDPACTYPPAIPEDDLRLTQPMLLSCSLTDGGEVVTVADWTLCHCSSIESVAYVELADTIIHDFLHHQFEDTKEIASYYRSLKKLQSQDAELGNYLFDQHLEL